MRLNENLERDSNMDGGIPPSDDVYANQLGDTRPRDGAPLPPPTVGELIEAEDARPYRQNVGPFRELVESGGVWYAVFGDGKNNTYYPVPAPANGASPAESTAPNNAPMGPLLPEETPEPVTAHIDGSAPADQYMTKEEMSAIVQQLALQAKQLAASSAETAPAPAPAPDAGQPPVKEAVPVSRYQRIEDRLPGLTKLAVAVPVGIFLGVREVWRSRTHAGREANEHARIVRQQLRANAQVIKRMARDAEERP